MRSEAVTEETRRQGTPREAPFVPLNYFRRRHGGFLSAEKEQCPSNAGWYIAVTTSFFRVKFTTIPSLTNKFWTLGCLYFWRVVVEFVPLYGAREEWLASARVGLLHYSTGFFFFPGLPWIMFFPYKLHLTALYIETTQLWSARGKKL